MRTKYIFWLIASVAALLLFVLSGCYTQVATVREEQPQARQDYDTLQDHPEGYAAEGDTNYEENENPPVVNNYYGNGWHPWAGFNYYYPSYYWPSYAFGVAYNDPWFYDSYWAYDPWWCGTPYIGYPYYGSYYSRPAFYGYGIYSPYYHHYYANGGTFHGTRIFGSARGSVRRGAAAGGTDYRGASTNTGSTSSLPAPAALSRSRVGSVRSSSTAVGRSSRQGNSQNSYVPRSGSRTTGRSAYGTRGSQGRSTSGYTGGTRSYGAPRASSPAPRSYSPPARSGGVSAPSGGGTRGGSGGSTPSGGGARSGGGGSRAGSGSRSGGRR